jgi:hypothetical protein
MLATHHLRTCTEQMRGRSVNRCASRVMDGGSLTIIACGFGLPRLWSMAATAVVDGFVHGYTTAGGKGRARIDTAVRIARESLTKQCETLVERLVPDVAFVAVVLDGDIAHVVNAGPARAYLHRGTEPKRLTPREESREGILRAPLAHSSVSLAPRDLLLLGTESAFSVRAIGKLSNMLAPGADPDASAVTEALLGPAVEAGVAASAAALRVH